MQKLKVAWTFDTGDSFKDSEMQCNPIVVDGILYATTPKLRVIALDAATGKLRWSFDPNEHEGRPEIAQPRRDVLGKRGGPAHPVCLAAMLYALDAGTGKRDCEFRRRRAGRSARRPGPRSGDADGPAPRRAWIYKDLLILGSTTGETLPAAPGDIRAYDVAHRQMRWTFHTIPHPGEFGYETWPKDAWKYSGRRITGRA